MNRDHLKINVITTTRKSLSRRDITTECFAVIYKGVEINRFFDRDAAERCIEEVINVRDDAELEFDEALRRDGYDIPENK